MATFSERLRSLRAEKDLTRQALSNLIGITHSSINMYERGEREPGLETLEIIADFFNVDMDYLLGRQDVPRKIDFSNIAPATTLPDSSSKGTYPTEKKTVNKEIFARRLTLLMEEKNETTYSMADRFSLSSPTISRYMTGQMAAKVTTIELMAKYFNVNPIWLMGYDVERAMPRIMPPIALTDHEHKVVTSYRKHPEMQPAIDRLLGIVEEPEHLMPVAAHNDNHDEEQQELMQKDLDKL